MTFYGETNSSDASNSSAQPVQNIVGWSKVVDVDVPHNSKADSFFFQYISIQQGKSYLMVGWSECSWQPDVPLVTVYDSQKGWTFYPEIALYPANVNPDNYAFEIKYQENGIWQAWVNTGHTPSSTVRHLLLSININVTPSSTVYVREGITLYSATSKWFNIFNDGAAISASLNSLIGGWQAFTYITPTGSYGPYTWKAMNGILELQNNPAYTTPNSSPTATTTSSPTASIPTVTPSSSTDKIVSGESSNPINASTAPSEPTPSNLENTSQAPTSPTAELSGSNENNQNDPNATSNPVPEINVSFAIASLAVISLAVLLIRKKNTL